MQAPIGKIGVGICSLALLLNVIGLSIPYWVSGGGKGSDEVSWHSGLWDACGNFNGVSACESPEMLNPLPTPRKIMQAVRAMELLGMFSSIAALVLAVIKEFNIKILLVRDRVLGQCAGFGALVAGGFMSIGLIVFISEKNTLLLGDVTAKLGAGFGLCVAGGVLSFISGSMFLLSKDETHTYSET